MCEIKSICHCFGLHQSNSRPHLYALYPTQTTNSSKIPLPKNLDDEVDNDDNQDEFTRFLLIKMPWLEDVRALPGEYIKILNEKKSIMMTH